MTAGAIPSLSPLEQRVAGVVAETLKISVDVIWPNESFAALGMDSLGAVETTAALEDELGIELPVTVMHEYPDLQSLCAFIESGLMTRAPDALECMLADTVLARDIRPIRSGTGQAARSTLAARSVLLTGATGFVGAHLLRTIADETDALIHCLVRPGPGNPAARLRQQLERYGAWSPTLSRRIAVVQGDLGASRLGLSRDAYQQLAGAVDVVYHAAADVNWVRSYDALRSTNVLGTVEVLRFACTGAPKPVHFLSSVAVCHSTTGPRTVDERTNPLEAIDGLRLGYAQSKCVAEALVREAGARGLPVTILRSSLVTGESAHGRSNEDDLVSRFIAGCIAMRAAPDLDWRMDCVPVDEVVSSIFRLSLKHDHGMTVAHLAADRPRHWRECVLWMRLRGYDVELIPYREWMEVLRATDGAHNPLHALRSFFLHTFAADGDLTLPELFEEPRRARVLHASTRRALAGLHVSPRPIGPRLLARYFDDLERTGTIPRPPDQGCHPEEAGAKRPATEGSLSCQGSSPWSPAEEPRPTALMSSLTDALAGPLADRSLRLESISLASIETDDSIVAELTSWRTRRVTQPGLYSATLSVVAPDGDRRAIKLFVKSKVADTDVIDVAQAVAALASPALGQTVEQFRDHLGFTRCHVRELALYEHPDPRLRSHMPGVLAVHRNDGASQWMLALESIDDARIMNAVDDCKRWNDEAIEAAIVGLARIHAVGFERGTGEALSAATWSAPRRNAHQRVAMAPLWSALATHACERSSSWSGRDLRDLRSVHDRLVGDVGSWARALDVSRQTLIHNDFNPRNIAIRGTPGALTLCAFDWELATMGVPQRDLAELLSFVLPVDAPSSTIAHWVTRHRVLLEQETGTCFRADAWDIGFRAALCDLLVDRLASYAMIDRIRSQTFLPRVVRSWWNVYRHYPWIPMSSS